MSLPLASLSLDLDNKWSYLKTHGDPAWRDLPSYLPVVVPRILDFLAARRLRITFFVVGQDAALPGHGPLLRSLADAGHEIGNHSFHHEPWLHLYREEEIEAELDLAEEHLLRATGARPIGFRGPGYSLSRSTLRVLARRGYRYDASTFPTFLGPLARAYYFATARLTPDEKRERARLFGTWSEGLRPLRPYRWDLPEGPLVEIPVTTLPGCRVPIHLSYVLYLACYSRVAALAYFRSALAVCRATQVQPSILLHPLDFLGADDDAGLSFFPGMRLSSALKLELMGRAIDLLCAAFHVVPMCEHAAHCAAAPLHEPRFSDAGPPVLPRQSLAQAQ